MRTPAKVAELTRALAQAKRAAEAMSSQRATKR